MARRGIDESDMSLASPDPTFEVSVSRVLTGLSEVGKRSFMIAVERALSLWKLLENESDYRK